MVVGGTVSSPRILSPSVSSPTFWKPGPVHSITLVPWFPASGRFSLGGRDAQSLIWACALIRGRPAGHPRLVSAFRRVSSAELLTEKGRALYCRPVHPSPWCLLCGTTWNGSGTEGSGVGSMWLNHVDFTPTCPPPGLSACSLRRPIQAPVWDPSPGGLMLTRHLNEWIGTMLCDLKRSRIFFFSIEEWPAIMDLPQFSSSDRKICIQQMKCQGTKIKLLYDCILWVILVHKHTEFLLLSYFLWYKHIW